MFHVFLVWMAAALVLGTAALVWIMLCGATAHWGDKEGLAFWKTFALSFVFTPLTGALVVLALQATSSGTHAGANRKPRLTTSHEFNPLK